MARPAISIVFFFPLLFSLLGCAAAYADEAPVETVVVRGQRTPLGALPYKDFYVASKGFQAETKGLAAFGLLLSPSSKDVSLDGLLVRLSNDDEDIEIPLLNQRLVDLPLVDSMVETGDIVVNKPKGAIKGSIVTFPRVDRDKWTVGLARGLVQDVNRATPIIRALFPWYARPFIHGIDSVGFCSKRAGAKILVVNGREELAELSTSERTRDDFGQDVYCLKSGGMEKYPAGASVRFADDVEAIFL